MNTLVNRTTTIDLPRNEIVILTLEDGTQIELLAKGTAFLVTPTIGEDSTPLEVTPAGDGKWWLSTKS